MCSNQVVAVDADSKPKSGRIINYYVFVIIVIFVFLALSLMAPNPPSDSQDIRNKLADEEAVDTEICELKPICEEFGGVRQVCAVAGNIDQCVKIKMGSKLDISKKCNDDGTVRGSENINPSFLRCLSLRKSFRKYFYPIPK